MRTGEQASESIQPIFRSWDEIRANLDEMGLALVLGFALIAGLRWLVPKLASLLPDRFRFYILPWEPILRLLILVALFTLVTPLIIRPTPQNLLTIGGGLAVAVGFAFKDYVSSLVAGIVALYERPYRRDDWVEIEGVYGEVFAVGLRTVTLRTPDDTLVAIPHAKIWSRAIHNANAGQPDLMCVAHFYLQPDHDADMVRRALADVAYTSPWLQLDRQVAVVVAEKPWATHYRLKAYPIDGRDQFRFLTDLTVRGKATLRRLGVRAAAASPSVPAGA